jgi:hypothetical protein
MRDRDMGDFGRSMVPHCDATASARAPRYRCAAEQRNELAAVHSITSSARASSVGGLSRPSTVAVIRVTTKSNLTDLLNQKVARLRPAENLLENIRD